MQAPMTSAAGGQSRCRYGQNSHHTEHADNDPPNGHDSGPACVEAIEEETWEGSVPNA